MIPCENCDYMNDVIGELNGEIDGLKAALSEAKAELDRKEAHIRAMTVEIIELMDKDKRNIPMMTTLYGVPIDRYAEFLDAITRNSDKAAQDVLEALSEAQAKIQENMEWANKMRQSYEDELAKLKAENYEILDVARHTHQARRSVQGVLMDACNQCGLDLRHVVHFRSATPAPEEK